MWDLMTACGGRLNISRNTFECSSPQNLGNTLMLLMHSIHLSNIPIKHIKTSLRAVCPYVRTGCLSVRAYIREGLITRSSSSKLLPLVFLLPLIYYLRKHLSLSISDWFGVSVIFFGSQCKIQGEIDAQIYFGHNFWQINMVIWSSGHLVIWSSVDLVFWLKWSKWSIWSSGHLVIWSSSHLAI